MRISYIAGDNVISSLGFLTAENFENLKKGRTGIESGIYSHLYPEAFPASLVDQNILRTKAALLKIEKLYTYFEQLLIISITEALKETNVDVHSPSTLIILSTTKGNIDLLKNNPMNVDSDRVMLWRSAKLIGDYFMAAETPLVISNACISGVLALNTADRFIKSGKYQNVIVAGVDVLSEFIVSGFQSFLSLSKGPCQPFDKDRSGLSLGEGAGTVVLTSDKSLAKQPFIEIVSGSGSNDANHISGPSRTGEGLYIAISEVLKGNPSPDFISAHGTATPYNDDMESIAFSRAGLNAVPVNSYKGYIGLTLGAAGIIESVYSFETMRNNLLIKTAGYEIPGTIEKINVVAENTTANVNHVLKTASGFGGSNAAILFRKSEG
ncbi:MAG: beta-ketoacyl synthase N-terminal-like domain-containing protein [Bacteroidales bacterium]